jgi:hypothetical protein
MVCIFAWPLISTSRVALGSRNQKVVEQLGENLGDDLGQAVACVDLPWDGVKNEGTNLDSSPCNRCYDALLCFYIWRKEEIEVAKRGCPRVGIKCIYHGEVFGV